MRNLQQVQVRTGSSFERICPFPVGYIYMSTNSTSPASTYGGTWSPLTDSKFLRPSGSWNSTGGESSHTLTVQEMPSHTHGIWYSASQSTITKEAVFTVSGWSRPGWGGHYMDATGGNAAHNNLPPYRTCYCWYRTA